MCRYGGVARWPSGIFVRKVITITTVENSTYPSKDGIIKNSHRGGVYNISYKNREVTKKKNPPEDEEPEDALATGDLSAYIPTSYEYIYVIILGRGRRREKRAKTYGACGVVCGSYGKECFWGGVVIKFLKTIIVGTPHHTTSVL